MKRNMTTFFTTAWAVYGALTCAEKEYLRITSEEGADEHCQAGAMSLFHQRIFDWLDRVIGSEARRSSRRLPEEPGMTSSAQLPLAYRMATPSSDQA